MIVSRKRKNKKGKKVERRLRKGKKKKDGDEKKT
jgi:hypothetical protein